jgi:glyoxylate/hydroxypyruvate reductase A
MTKEIMIFHSEYHRYRDWKSALEAELPDLELVDSRDEVDADLVRYALVWSTPHGYLNQFRNLKMIVNLGAGVDHIVDRVDLPSVRITRLSDPAMVRMMASYVTFSVLRYLRDIPECEAQQRQHVWRFIHQRDADTYKVGVLGLGELGGSAALELARHGLDVRGWSRSAKEITGITCSHGIDNLDAFLPELDVLVLLLPLTEATRRILDRRRLSLLKSGIKIINPGRGALIEESALIEKLQSGHVGGVTLDTVETEPLAVESPLWDMPHVLITPHLASRPHPEVAARQIADNIRCIRSERPISFEVDRARGY